MVDKKLDWLGKPAPAHFKPALRVPPAARPAPLQSEPPIELDPMELIYSIPPPLTSLIDLGWDIDSDPAPEAPKAAPDRVPKAAPPLPKVAAMVPISEPQRAEPVSFVVPEAEPISLVPEAEPVSFSEIEITDIGASDLKSPFALRPPPTFSSDLGDVAIVATTAPARSTMGLARVKKPWGAVAAAAALAVAALAAAVSWGLIRAVVHRESTPDALASTALRETPERAEPPAAEPATPAESVATTAPRRTPRATVRNEGATPISRRERLPPPARPSRAPSSRDEAPPPAAPEPSPTRPPAPTPWSSPTAASGDAAFDASAAMQALRQAADRAQSCRQAGAATGNARVAVTFAPSGRVTSAVLEGPLFARTPIGNCIVDKFRTLRISPWSGSSTTVHRTILF